MATSDDFAAFAGSEQMFFGLSEPFQLIRHSTETMLRQQVPDTVLRRIVTLGKPKFLTLGRKQVRWFRERVLVTHFAFCVRATLDVTSDGGANQLTLDSALTFLFGNIHERGAEVSRSYVDLGADVEEGFTDDVFKNRFLEFRLSSLRDDAG